MESYFSTVTDLAILLKQDPTTGVFVKTFQNFQNGYFLLTPRFYVTAASEFTDNSHSFCTLFPATLLCRDKEGAEGWPVQDFMLEVLLVNNILRI